MSEVFEQFNAGPYDLWQICHSSLDASENILSAMSVMSENSLLDRGNQAMISDDFPTPTENSSSTTLHRVDHTWKPSQRRHSLSP